MSLRNCVVNPLILPSPGHSFAGGQSRCQQLEREMVIDKGRISFLSAKRGGGKRVSAWVFFSSFSSSSMIGESYSNGYITHFFDFSRFASPPSSLA